MLLSLQQKEGLEGIRLREGPGYYEMFFYTVTRLDDSTSSLANNES